MWKFEPVHFTYELVISYVKMPSLHMWNENFIYEDVPIPYVFHMWNLRKRRGARNSSITLLLDRV